MKYSIGIRWVWGMAFNSGGLVVHPIFTWKFTCSALPAMLCVNHYRGLC
ncbi:MAG: hypothetical protein WBF45_04980 [Acidobacteriaceae bacterium]